LQPGSAPTAGRHTRCDENALGFCGILSQRCLCITGVRRAFISFQLMIILEDNHHNFLIVQHDPLLYEDAGHMVEYVAQHLRQTYREATVLLYARPWTLTYRRWPGRPIGCSASTMSRLLGRPGLCHERTRQRLT
jgi:hypothetical protein